MQSRFKLINIIIVLIIFSAIFFALGIYFGLKKEPEVNKVTSLFNKSSELVDQTNFEDFWKVWNLINEKYPSVEEISDQEKIWGSISGLVSSLNDPYSMFLPPEETKLFEESINGKFSGVGMEIVKKDGIITIVSPLKNTPAYKAGIKSGDKIIKIDDKTTSDLSVEGAARLIRGEQGTEVILTIFREKDDETKEITIIRDIIAIPTIETEVLPEGIFVIELYNFSADSTNLFRDALREFINSGTTRLILDLRNNPGGYLDSAIDITSWFLPLGKSITIEDFNIPEKEKIHRSKGYDIFTKNLKMVILIDGGSASASEIVAGALKEHGIATLVGEKTFGKGSVQELVNISSDTRLKITIAKWLTPERVSISENGLIPDVVIEPTKKDLEIGGDPQKDKAVEILLNQ